MSELIAVVTITLLAVVSPGPDFAMVTRNSLMLTRRAGVLTAAGIGLGVTVHVSYTLLGVGLLISRSLTTVFIVSLFMQAVHADTPLLIQTGYGAFIALAHVAWFSIVACCFSVSAFRTQLLAFRHWIDRTFGCLLLVFGVKLATSHFSR
jgi:threonine/homoserine/homoserine lactone efflux protein